MADTFLNEAQESVDKDFNSIKSVEAAKAIYEKYRQQSDQLLRIFEAMKVSQEGESRGYSEEAIRGELQLLDEEERLVLAEEARLKEEERELQQELLKVHEVLTSSLMAGLGSSIARRGSGTSPITSK